MYYFAFFQVGLFFGYPEFITAYGLLDDEKIRLQMNQHLLGKDFCIAFPKLMFKSNDIIFQNGQSSFYT